MVGRCCVEFACSYLKCELQDRDDHLMVVFVKKKYEKARALSTDQQRLIPSNIQ